MIYGSDSGKREEVLCNISYLQILPDPENLLLLAHLWSREELECHPCPGVLALQVRL